MIIEQLAERTLDESTAPEAIEQRAAHTTRSYIEIAVFVPARLDHPDGTQQSCHRDVRHARERSDHARRGAEIPKLALPPHTLHERETYAIDTHDQMASRSHRPRLFLCAVSDRRAWLRINEARVGNQKHDGD